MPGVPSSTRVSPLRATPTGVLYSYFSDPDGNMWALQHWPAGYQA